MDLTTRQYVPLTETFARYHFMAVHIPTRSALFVQLYQEEADKIKFVQFSEDWQSVLVRLLADNPQFVIASVG